MDVASWLNTDFLNGLGVVGICVLVLLLLIFGKGLALTREVKDRDKTIAWQRLSMDEKDKQIALLLGGTQVSVEALHKVSTAAERIAGGG